MLDWIKQNPKQAGLVALVVVLMLLWWWGSMAGSAATTQTMMGPTGILTNTAAASWRQKKQGMSLGPLSDAKNTIMMKSAKNPM